VLVALCERACVKNEDDDDELESDVADCECGSEPLAHALPDGPDVERSADECCCCCCGGGLRAAYEGRRRAVDAGVPSEPGDATAAAAAPGGAKTEEPGALPLLGVLLALRSCVPGAKACAADSVGRRTRGCGEPAVADGLARETEVVESGQRSAGSGERDEGVDGAGSTSRAAAAEAAAARPCGSGSQPAAAASQRSSAASSRGRRAAVAAARRGSLR
jgi:hypothetical protein